jgi:hypothetical protein
MSRELVSIRFIDCIINRDGTYKINNLVEGQENYLRVYKENFEGKQVLLENAYVAYDKNDIYKLYYNGNEKIKKRVIFREKTIGQLIDEFCINTYPDYMLFGISLGGCEGGVIVEESEGASEGASEGTSEGNASNELFSFHSPVEQFKNKRIVVKGYVQSGKTLFMITGTYKFLSRGFNVVIVLRNSKKDKEQIKGRIHSITKKLYDWLPKNYKSHFNIKVLDNIKPENILKISKKQTVYISIGHEAPLKKYVDMLNDHPELNKKFALFIDEVDFIDSGNTEVEKQIAKLKEKCYCRFEVSATVLDPILGDN